MFVTVLRRGSIGLVGSLAALFSPPACAEDTEEAPASADIIVTGVADRQLLLDARSETGSRLGLSVRETPAIVDILSQELMQERGLRTTIEALNATPGATSGELASSPGQLSMRGFTGGAISLLYDGVRQTNSALIIRNLDSWSFDRIEVLKGPAGVLYGEGSLAGAVNLVPKKPRFGETGFAATAGYGSFAAFRAGVDANAVLSDKVAVRGVGSINRTSGFVDDSDARFLAATFGVTVRPTERLTIELAADYLEDRYGTAYWGTPLVPASVARDPSALVRTADGYVIEGAEDEELQCRQCRSGLRNLVAAVARDLRDFGCAALRQRVELLRRRSSFPQFGGLQLCRAERGIPERGVPARYDADRS